MANVQKLAGQKIYKLQTNEIMAKNIRTRYRTNVPNILGGYMTYSTLAEAWEHLGEVVCGVKCTTIIAETVVNAGWWHGRHVGHLDEVISRGVVWRQ